MKKNVDRNFLAKANEKLKNTDVDTILKWLFKTFPEDEVGMTTAFGYSGVVLLHHVIQIKPKIQLYFIDTGFHFKETLEFTKFITNAWSLNLKIVKPDISKKELIRKLGEKPYKTNADLCCHYCKVEPLLRFLHDKTVWLSGIRKDQSPTRLEVEPIDIDGRGAIKVSPIYDWTQKKTLEYIKNNNIPYNPLVDKGYLSIGCKPCTRKIRKGESERDGRWPFMQRLECGIHLYNKK